MTKEAKNQHNREYRLSPRGKEIGVKYYKTPKRKEGYKIYAKSDKGRIAKKRYNQSLKGKASQKKYMQSPKGKAYMIEYNCKWYKSSNGKESVRKRNARRKHLGFIPLNKPFKGCEGHHIDRDIVIYIPKKLHRSVWHSLTSGVGMDKINKLAFDYLKNTYPLVIV